MTLDELLHFIGGALLALPSRFTCTLEEQREVIREIDMFGIEREWKQNLKGTTPNEFLSDHQLDEAEAWGKGARKVLGFDPRLPYEYDRRRL